MSATHGGQLAPRSGWRLWVAAAVAMTAFASNSLLNRFALGTESIDPTTFTVVRIGSGGLMLLLLVALRRDDGQPAPGRGAATRSAVLLVVYAGAFSLAYVSIDAGTGALLLFGAVQIVLYGSAIRRGERPGRLGWVALAVASTGVVGLLAPGASAPNLTGALLMLVAGAAWGGYTLLGRSARDALGATALNFGYAVPIVLLLEVVVVVVAGAEVRAEPVGIALAAASGALASALGYALWYAVLPALTGAQSGIVQLAPAPIAIVGGLVLLGEPVTTRVLVASLLVVAGVALGLVGPRRPS